MLGGGSHLICGPSAKPSGSLSARTCKCKIFCTSVSSKEVWGSGLIVKVSGAQKFNLGVPRGLGSQGNKVSSNMQF